MSGFWSNNHKQPNHRYRGWTFVGDKMFPISRKGKLLMKRGIKVVPPENIPYDAEPLDEENIT